MTTTSRLGSLDTSRLGLGCMGFSQGYGPADDAQSIATIRRALDEGVTHIDTAMSYGRGHNEELVGRAIAGRRSEVTIATKFGIVRHADGVRLDGRPDHVRGYAESSLRRLGTDVIDIYYLHRVDPDVPIADTIGAMADLVDAGLVRRLGVSEVNASQLEEAASTHPIAALQSEWSLFWREPEDDVVPAARALGIGLVAYSPLGRGLLTGTLQAEPFPAGDFRHGDPRFSGPTLRTNLDVVDAVCELALEKGVTPGQLALAWLLAQGDDVVPIPGTRRPDRVTENAGSLQVALTQADLDRLEGIAGRPSWAGDRQSFAAHGTVRTPSPASV